jgi:hypothetical protein
MYNRCTALPILSSTPMEDKTGKQGEAGVGIAGPYPVTYVRPLIANLIFLCSSLSDQRLRSLLFSLYKILIPYLYSFRSFLTTVCSNPNIRPGG